MRTAVAITVTVALSAPAATGEPEVVLSTETLGWTLLVVQVVGLVVLGFFLRGFVLNQIAYIQIHIQNMLARDFIPRPDIVERFERIEKRYDPLAERVAVIESKLGRGVSE